MNPSMPGLAKIGGRYSYGVDATGQTYIYDQSAGKMIYYGSQAGALPVTNNLAATGGNLIYEGNKYVQPSASSTTQASAVNTSTPAAAPASNTVVGTGGGGTGTAPKVLDTAQLTSLDALLGNIDSARNTAKQTAALTRDAHINEKAKEKQQETSKYDGKKLTTLQDFSGAKTETDLNTRNTLENLVSSLSTMGLGGSRALTRQILDAANISNRKANATQATANQGLDTAFNDYNAGNENDVKKINDQFGYDTGQAEQKWGQDTQNTLYKKADVYNAANDTAGRQSMMQQGDALSSAIQSAPFVNPSYDGTVKAMATPDAANYTQDIAKYDTTAIGAGGAPGAAPGGVTPAAGGNLAMRAVAVNNKDFGVKKQTEGNLGYGA